MSKQNGKGTKVLPVHFGCVLKFRPPIGRRAKAHPQKQRQQDLVAYARSHAKVCIFFGTEDKKHTFLSIDS